MAGKYGIARERAQELAGYRAQLEHYKHIVMALLKVAMKLTDEEAASFRVPPLELAPNANDDEVVVAMQAWFDALLDERLADQRCWSCNARYDGSME